MTRPPDLKEIDEQVENVEQRTKKERGRKPRTFGKSRQFCRIKSRKTSQEERHRSNPEWREKGSNRGVRSTRKSSRRSQQNDRHPVTRLSNRGLVAFAQHGEGTAERVVSQ